MRLTQNHFNLLEMTTDEDRVKVKTAYTLKEKQLGDEKAKNARLEEELEQLRKKTKRDRSKS